MSCILCQDRTPSGEFICKKCLSKLTEKPPLTCSKCGEKLEQDYRLCYSCKNEMRYYDKLYNLGFYQREMGDIVKKIKFRENIKLCRYMGGVLGEELKRRFPGTELIIPVPVSKTRFHERGFNQALELARGVGSVMKKKVLNNLVLKDDVPPLENRGRKERKRIMRNCFQPSRKIGKVEGKNLLIIDDVYTTGSTVNYLAKLLRKYKPVRINVGVISR